jgi:hypothetical protein
MTPAVALAVCAAMLSSTVIVVVVTSTGLQRTPFCIMPSLGIVVLVWMAYPPAQQLPPIISIVVWALITLALYHFPISQSQTPTAGSPSPTDDDLLDTFFKETHTS